MGKITRKFDTKVQHLKYRVLREVAKRKWDDTLSSSLLDIPKIIAPGKTPTVRCCVYKERAIVSDRIKLAMGEDVSENDNVIQVIGIACDECPAGGYEVGTACRGCLAHRCEDVCDFGAISFDRNHVAHIDKSKCRECGKCARVCPYAAITNRKRPCESACKIKAISMNENTQEAEIDNSKCIACGACVYHCPWGAISDKSYICQTIDLIKGSNGGKSYKLYAVVAPAISSQFTYAKLGQVVSGIKALGFDEVWEAALGADMVAESESAELAERGFLISSCCPAFVDYVKKHFQQYIPDISSSLSPMARISKYIKDHDKNARVIFIGPCTSKKREFKKAEVAPYVDCVITFEELQALFDSKDIEITVLDEEKMDTASYFGRIFARCGGLSDAIKQGVAEQGKDFKVRSVSCDGIDQCRSALAKLSYGKIEANFIEGMACVDGCVGGAGCLVHGGHISAENVEKSALEGKSSILEATKPYSND
ncbi:MAG: 4Fe-4S dicluster domain-containing protein [Clostridia bacterium]|nr:4Fe-4S dicluster domain-containing protein [Clostridia bacterium]